MNEWDWNEASAQKGMKVGVVLIALALVVLLAWAVIGNWWTVGAMTLTLIGLTLTLTRLRRERRERRGESDAAEEEPR